MFEGNGFSVVQLRAQQSTAITILTRVLGAPSTRLTSSPELVNCGVDAVMGWHALTVFFDHHRLVGLAYGPGRTPAGATVAGLQLGDTAQVARTIYGVKFTTSLAQGGSWFAATPTGRIDGYLTPSGTGALRRSARILTIDVGVVGCPAMSP